MVSVLAIRSDGERFKYEAGDWKLLGLEGLDSPPIIIDKEPRAFGHGALITKQQKQARDIKIKARLTNSSAYITERQKVIGFHNSNYKFNLIIEYLGVVRVARNCYLNAMSYPTDNVFKSPNLTVMYTSPYSDLFALNSEEASFVQVIPMWHNSRVYEGKSGRLAFGAIEPASEKVIEYLGSEPAPLNVRLDIAGQVQNIKIKVNENLFEIKGTFNNGDTLIIDAEKKVVLNNNSLLPLALYSLQSLIRLELVYGTNLIKIFSSDNERVAVGISYVGRYGGI